MRVAAIVSGVFLLATGLTAADLGDSKSESLGEVLDAHCKARSELASLRARFTQTEVFTVLDEREESAGEFAFLRPDMILWRFTSPDSSLSVIQGDSAWAVFPHVKQVHKMQVRGSSTDRVMSIIGFGSCGDHLTEGFDIPSAEESDSLTVLSMVPLSDDVSRYFALIELGLDPDDHLPRRIVFHEHSGDLLIFRFTDLRPNADVGRDEFEFGVPDGYELIEY